MKIKLLKDHLDNVSGETIEVTEERAYYLFRVGVANVNSKKQTKELKEPYSESNEGTKDIVTRLTPEESDYEIKEQNKK